MLKVSDVTATADQNGEFTNGVVAQGLAPTIIDAQWLNAVQRELVNAVEGSGQMLDKTDFSQLLKAIKRIVTEVSDDPMIGALQFFATCRPGDGWLRLPEKSTSTNATLSRAQYGKLFRKIGTTFGEGDGSTTFGLPTILDETGQFSCFLRPMLASGTIGAKHGDTIRDIKGNVASLRFGTIAEFIEDGPFYKENGENYSNVQTISATSNRHNIKFDVSRVMKTGLENTPNYAEYPIFIFVGRNSA